MNGEDIRDTGGPSPDEDPAQLDDPFEEDLADASSPQDRAADEADWIEQHRSIAEGADDDYPQSAG